MRKRLSSLVMVLVSLFAFAYLAGCSAGSETPKNYTEQELTALWEKGEACDLHKETDAAPLTNLYLEDPRGYSYHNYDFQRQDGGIYLERMDLPLTNVHVALRDGKRSMYSLLCCPDGTEIVMFLSWVPIVSSYSADKRCCVDMIGSCALHDPSREHSLAEYQGLKSGDDASGVATIDPLYLTAVDKIKNEVNWDGMSPSAYSENQETGELTNVHDVCLPQTLHLCSDGLVTIRYIRHQGRVEIYSITSSAAGAYPEYEDVYMFL